MNKNPFIFFEGTWEINYKKEKWDSGDLDKGGEGEEGNICK